MNWDDIKVFLALSRKGSARGAATVLRVSNSTITRRLDDMEHKLSTRLFDRTPDGYRMTAAAEQLLSTAEHVEELIMGAERKITGGDQELEGAIRLTMPPVGLAFLMDRLADFAHQYPGIELELLPSIEALDLSRREADIAIRVLGAGEKPPEYLIGRLLSPLTASAYVHKDLLNRDNPEDVSHMSWIGKFSGNQREEWLDQTDFPDQPVRHAIEDIALVAQAVEFKMGMAFMPCFSASFNDDIVRVPGATVVHHSDLWVVTHKDLRLSARLRVLREVIADEFARERHRIDTRSAS